MEGEAGQQENLLDSYEPQPEKENSHGLPILPVDESNDSWLNPWLDSPSSGGTWEPVFTPKWQGDSVDFGDFLPAGEPRSSFVDNYPLFSPETSRSMRYESTNRCIGLPVVGRQPRSVSFDPQPHSVENCASADRAGCSERQDTSSMAIGIGVSLDSLQVMNGKIMKVERVLVKEKRRTGTRRLGKNSACKLCKLRKVKCDNVLPCTSCIFLGKEYECIVQNSVVGEQEKPPLRSLDSRLMTFNDENNTNLTLLQRSAKTLGINIGAIRRSWEHGYPLNTLLRIFKSIPGELQDAIEQGLQALKAIATIRVKSIEDVARKQYEVEDMGELEEKISMRLGVRHDRWVSLGIDRYTGFRKDCLFGAQMCHCLGLSPDEFVPRFLENRLESHTEFDFVCLCLDILSHPQDRISERFWRISRKGAGGELVAGIMRITIARDFDAHGCLTRITLYYDEVDEDEFSRGLARNPNMWPSLDPNAKELPSYQELLGGFKKDLQFREKIAYIRKSNAGLKRLDQLTHKVRPMSRWLSLILPAPDPGELQALPPSQHLRAGLSSPRELLLT
eukprot:756410-Hanusia_phi.AAC.2